MQPARPYIPSQPCPACGRAVDPLRARRVLWMQDGARFLCDETCQARFALGERDFDAPPHRPSERPRVERPSIPELVREATLLRGDAGETASETTRARQYDPVIATGIAVVTLPLILFTPGRELGWLAAFLLVLCAAVNARIPLSTVRANPSLGVVAPLGLVLASLASVMASDSETQRWSLAGAAVAAIAVSISSPAVAHSAAKTARSPWPSDAFCELTTCTLPDALVRAAADRAACNVPLTPGVRLIEMTSGK